ncbi:MAG: hypothetical protein U0R17_02740 [Acidimicrobiia bacterium]
MKFLGLRRIWLILPIILIVVFVFVISGCSQLSGKESRINKNFSVLVPELKNRYSKLNEALTIAENVGGKRDVTSEGKKYLKEFNSAIKKKNVKNQLNAAQNLEIVIGRLRANAKLSNKLVNSKELSDAIRNLDNTEPGSINMDKYKKSVKDYESARTSWRLLISAMLGGYSAPQVLEISTSKK